MSISVLNRQAFHQLLPHATFTMGSSEEVTAVPDMDSSSAKESVNMDLYIDQAKERKMMLKFDVSLH